MPESGLATKIAPLRGREVIPEDEQARRRLRRHRRRLVERADGHRSAIPSNIPACPGHNWANAISMATPIAHKGVDGRRQGAVR